MFWGSPSSSPAIRPSHGTAYVAYENVAGVSPGSAEQDNGGPGNYFPGFPRDSELRCLRLSSPCRRGISAKGRLNRSLETDHHVSTRMSSG